MMAILKEAFFSGILFTLLLVSSIIAITHFFNLSKNPPTVTSDCEGLCETTSLLALATNFPTDNTNDVNEVKNWQKNPSFDKMMARVGTDLKFDANNQCPPGSLMLNRSQDFSPAHTNCPALFIVGARKGGTTSLYLYISKHPDFEGIEPRGGPSAGETFYFGRHYQRLSWEYYVSLFPSGATTGESTVENLVHKFVPSRLYEACGAQAKIIMLLRDPVRRLESNLLMRARMKRAEFSKNKGSQSISAVVNASLNHFYERAIKRTNALNPSEWHKFTGLFPASANMVFEGLYYVHLLNWLCNFPAENILILNSEEFFKSPSTILDIALQFLGLKRLDMATYKSMISVAYNKGTYDDDNRLRESDIKRLMEVYGPFNKALLELLQWNDASWL